jgi:hypothetical protein
MMVLMAVRFLAEIGMLVSLAWGGWALGDGMPWSVVLAVVAPLLAAAAWGRWVAPRATHRLGEPYRLAVELSLFAIGFVLVLRAEPSPQAGFFGLGVWLAFLVSMPARRVQV